LNNATAREFRIPPPAGAGVSNSQGLTAEEESNGGTNIPASSPGNELVQTGRRTRPAIMDDNLCYKRYERMLSQMHDGLCSVLSQMRYLKAVTPSPAELEQLVLCVAEIRHMLDELERMQFWSQADALGRSLSDLKRRFLDLEGRLKEQRNDRLSMG